jgi:hypothetical protein
MFRQAGAQDRDPSRRVLRRQLRVHLWRVVGGMRPAAIPKRSRILRCGCGMHLLGEARVQHRNQGGPSVCVIVRHRCLCIHVRQLVHRLWGADPVRSRVLWCRCRVHMFREARDQIRVSNRPNMLRHNSVRLHVRRMDHRLRGADPVRNRVVRRRCRLFVRGATDGTNEN